MKGFDLARAQARGLMRSAVPLMAGAVCLVLLAGRLKGIDLALVRDGVGQVSSAQWLAASGATALSFWALGRYDLVMHRHLRTGLPARQAERAGMAAIALSQVLGLGMVTGALARWRMLEGLGPLGAARVTAAVSLSFLAAWGVLAVLACLLLPGGPALPVPLTLAVLGAALALAALALWRPVLRLARWQLRLPSLPAMAAIGLYTLIDTTAAAAALHVLLPAEVSLGFEVLLPVYLLALGAGLFTSTPGGVGPFELALLALLPAVPVEPLLATVVCYRIVYYALPALLALPLLARPRRGHQHATTALPPVPEALLKVAARSESALARQNGGRLLRAGDAAALVVETGQTLTLLFDPLTDGLRPLLPALSRAARQANRLPCLYKCAAPTALEARAAGWHVLRVADEALLDPVRFDLSGPRHRQLRRKLRHAEKAGIEITALPPGSLLPLAELAALDTAWCANHGGARGFSTGRYSAQHVARQWIYLARQGGRAVAFMTFHGSRQERALDLMRYLPGLPDGTMHALVCAALEEARRDACPRLSLSAMPALCTEGPLLTRARAQAARWQGGAGLTRFKESFGPTRAPLYAAAPSRAALALGLADIALTIRGAGQAAIHSAATAPYEEGTFAPASGM
ncbi:phosphatidylglycerol lysyltransferase domain-containing protein [Pseudooceanicola nanhaiensis]|uniref:phosphatidylglycerol lysyltransferase domain-containing protein n=1 Tax=Pseudooceanicola nanhaiensis TaxID=375761 RepID=UPI001CD590FC|nr:phosphatidylglycerol lysyltransferase domain-containing protein [Pseudooceanicola nanhaiensis]MCA0919882.1 phosphatidylglycerol lysyltransferase domain-containing protein [Pseudooceanicola nanhaiensis]